MPRPALPATNVTRQSKEEYDCWVTYNNKVIAYILATIFNVLRAKFEYCENTRLFTRNIWVKERANLYKNYKKVHYY